jgi:hypothetical protein
MEAVALSDSLLRAMGNHRQVVRSPIDVRSSTATPIHFVVVGRISMECKHGFSDREALLSEPLSLLLAEESRFRGMEEVVGSIPIRSTNQPLLVNAWRQLDNLR